MNRFISLCIVLVAMVSAPAVQAATLDRMVIGEVTSVTGDNLGSGFGASVGNGFPVGFTISMDSSFALADLFDASPLQVAVDVGPNNALIQTCCTSATELDPTDGQISWSGGLGGFTGPQFGVYDLFAGDFSIVFNVSGSDVPMNPFATSDDVLAFLAAPTLAFEGFVEGVFINRNDDNDGFVQQVNFAYAPVPTIPLPAGIWLLLSGFAMLILRRRTVR